MNKTAVRVLGVIPAGLVQIAVFLLLASTLIPHAAVVTYVCSALGLLFSLYIVTKHDESSYKMLWLLVVLAFPVFGVTLYVMFGNKRTSRPVAHKVQQGKASMRPINLDKPSEACSELLAYDRRVGQAFRVVERASGYPAIRNAQARYYPSGEAMFEAMIDAMRGAQHYIYAEYFIVDNGFMFDTMMEIMEEKAACGVDVRLMYDDIGSLSTFSKANAQAVRARGVKCISFNPVKYLSGTLNYRDHRKILVIDGICAFSGGSNLADEYINRKTRFGHWKDSGLRVEGEPAAIYARMFAEFWNAFADDAPILRTSLQPLKIQGVRVADAAAAMADKAAGNLEECPRTPLDAQEGEVCGRASGSMRQENTKGANEHESFDGYVLSYYDSPVASDNITNDLYIELLSQANCYAWFFTPYLLPGESLINAFRRAAIRGVDVRIIMPGIPDKPFIYRMSRAHYQILLEAGVRIYEYAPGFVHSKACVIDDRLGAVGTVNLDHRSLFLHFENNALFYEASLLQDVKIDFLNTQRRCRERTLEQVGTGFFTWLCDSVLRVLSPLC